jgi:hypothetical protein
MNKYLIYFLIILITPFIAAVVEQYIFGNDLNDLYFVRQYNILYIPVYALAAALMIIMYESFGTNKLGNILFLTLITTIILIIGECITGILLDSSGKKVWNYHNWDNEYMFPFCSGHNSVAISIKIFVVVLIFYLLLNFINKMNK